MRRLEDFEDAHLRVFERPAVAGPDEIRSVYVIGICGTGMGSLAGLFQQAGYRVCGSDAAVYPPMSTRLAEMGIEVLEGFDPSHLEPAPDLVIVANACTPTHVEAAYARDHRLVQQSFPEALAHFFIRDRRSLVITGTHGKTTTTGLLVHLFREAKRDPGFLVGGVMVNGSVSYGVGTGEHFVIEGDEYDTAYFDKRPKFLHYRPASAVVTSIEFDHADIYENLDDYVAAFRSFVGLVPQDGLLVLNGDDDLVRMLAASAGSRVQYYGLDDARNDITARNVHPLDGGQHFALVAPGVEPFEVFLPMSGRHNLMNALAASAVALNEGLRPDDITTGFASFRGMKRRQEIRGAVNNIIVLDDFAHHPTAVRETIRSVRERWQGRRLVAVFEPRSNTSRRKVFESAYTEAFAEADVVFLSAPPLRHNDRKQDFMDVRHVESMLRLNGTETIIQPNADALLPLLAEAVQPDDIVLIMSNGGFGNIHERLLDELRSRADKAQSKGGNSRSEL